MLYKTKLTKRQHHANVLIKIAMDTTNCHLESATTTTWLWENHLLPTMLKRKPETTAVLSPLLTITLHTANDQHSLTSRSGHEEKTTKIQRSNHAAELAGGYAPNCATSKNNRL